MMTGMRPVALLITAVLAVVPILTWGSASGSWARSPSKA